MLSCSWAPLCISVQEKNSDPSQPPTNVREIDRWPLCFRYGWKKDQRTNGGCPSLETVLAQLRVWDSCWRLAGRIINDNEIIERQSGWQAAAFRQFITKHCWENSPYKISFTHRVVHYIKCITATISYVQHFSSSSFHHLLTLCLIRI